MVPRSNAELPTPTCEPDEVEGTTSHTWEWFVCFHVAAKTFLGQFFLM